MNERIANLQRLLERHPTDPRLRLGLAMEYEKLAQWADVVRELEQYLAATDDQGNAWGRFAHALRQLGQDTEARAAYQRGIEAANRHGHPSMAADFEDALTDW